LLNLIKQIADAGATFKSLKDHWADTTTAQGRLMLTVLGGLAEFESSSAPVRAVRAPRPTVCGLAEGRN
jgi:DNA invertase Pin-like site-specific DNA recombinase